MTKINPENVILVGIGHPARGDDALGVIVIEQLRKLLPGNIATAVCTGDIADLFEIFESYHMVIIVDAILTQVNPPGTLYQLMNDEIIPHASECRVSTHAFDLGQAIEMAKNLSLLPNTLIIFGIEAAQFDHGAPLSAAVSAQLPTLIDAIHEFLRSI